MELLSVFRQAPKIGPAQRFLKITAAIWFGIDRGWNLGTVNPRSYLNQPDILSDSITFSPAGSQWISNSNCSAKSITDPALDSLLRLDLDFARAYLDSFLN